MRFLDLPGATKVPGRGSRKPVEGVLVLEASPAGAAELSEVAVTVPGQARLELPVGSTWRLRLRASGLWAQDRVLTVGPEGGSATLEARPAATLAGAVAMPPHEDLPGELELRLRGAPGVEDPLPDIQISCPVTAEAQEAGTPEISPAKTVSTLRGRWRCTVPAGRHDLRLRARGYLSRRFWGRELSPGETADLGGLELRRGASVVGWLTAPAPPRGFSFLRCETRLEPLLAGVRGREDHERRPVLAASEAVNGRGFFELPGVAPGSYRLAAVCPGYAPSRLSPVTVLAGAETEVGPLELAPPISLSLRLSPEVTPFHTSWKVSLLRQSPLPGHLDEAAGGDASPEGLWSRGDLEPGLYRLRIEDGRGSTWLRREVELPAAQEPLELSLPCRRLEGLVTLGEEEPVAARVALQSDSGPRMSVRSGEDGRFYVFLPFRDEGQGPWSVEVNASTLGIDYRFEEVEIPEREEDAPWARIHLRLPDTALEGVVVDEDGRPVAGGQIRALAMWGERGKLSPSASAPLRGADGSFRLRGLDSGPWRLEAEAQLGGERLSGALVGIDVREGAELEPVRLVLRRQRRLEGQVTAPDGRGIAGARLVGLLEQPLERRWSTWPEAFTDLDGAFALDLPASAPAVQLTVFPPGFAVTQLRVPLDRVPLDRVPLEHVLEPVIITAEELGGTLRLRVEESSEARRALSGVAVVGEYVLAELGSLIHWSTLHGLYGGPDVAVEFAIPHLPPGLYSVCPYEERLFRGLGLDAELAARCTRGLLAPDGELELIVPTLEPP